MIFIYDNEYVINVYFIITLKYWAGNIFPPSPYVLLPGVATFLVFLLDCVLRCGRPDGGRKCYSCCYYYDRGRWKKVALLLMKNLWKHEMPGSPS